jgi:putative membrane protein
MSERILVLAVDIDNDLYKKARLTGPIIGRASNLKSATKMALSDPTDTDANAMFEAVKKYDELKKQGFDVEVATITGSEKEGYVADREITRQIERVIDIVKPDSCLFVTDGKSDERALPLLKGRIKVDSVDVVHMKQAATLENTYFVILEKIKDPHYARIIFGIPAVLLILFAISYYLNYGWQLPVALIGIYLIIKGFGIEDRFLESFKGFGFSIGRISFIFYTAALVFFILGFAVGYSGYVQHSTSTNNLLVLYSYAIQDFIIPFAGGLVIYLIGRAIDLEGRRMRFQLLNQGIYIAYSIISLSLVYFLAAWFIGQIYFWQFLLFGALSLIVGYAIATFSYVLKRIVIKNSKLKNKNVINDIGAYIGKVSGVDPKSELLYVKTDHGKIISFDIDRISKLTDWVIIR